MSGGDTNIQGAVVAGNSVQADIGGKLTIQSLQDTSTYTESSKNAGASITISPAGVPTGGSISAGKTNTHSNYQNVAEQSGIRAGDGGFTVNVQGGTTLTGGAITSTQAAIDNNKNSFNTGGTLTTSDIQNKAEYNASGFQVNASISTDKNGKTTPGGGAGIGSESGNASSTTQAAISGIAGNTAARTGDKESGIAQIFDKDKVQKEIDAQIKITQEFGQQASKAVGDYAQTQMNKALSLQAQAAQTSDPAQRDALLQQATDLQNQWGDNGTMRLTLHTVIGGLTGGVGGAAGAAAGTLSAPAVADALQNAGIDASGVLGQTITALASTAAGAAVGGTAGAVAAGNEVVNNYLKHAERLALAKAQKACFADAASAACGTVVALQVKDQLSDKLLSNAAASCKGAECNEVTNFIQTQMNSLGCTSPSACQDYNTLSSYLRVTQEKAQGLEAVYPEGWLLDAKAVLDLGKFGLKMLSGATGAKGSLDALGQLAKTDATTATNNFYRDGSNPAYWTNGKPGDGSLNLATHWEKHGAEFTNFNSANDYYRAANNFVTTPPPGTLVKTAPNGDVLLYNPAMNTFGVRTSDGLPRTMFKPDPSQHGYSTNIDFWNAK
ncbi:MAG: hemagglutinin repeat-containing protein [Comamonas sp.]|nr:hemagglutinin repeat-containing protein [Comamonas sp.]